MPSRPSSYEHYFYPTFLPLALIWASLDLPELSVVPLLSIIHIVPDTAADRVWAPKVLAMGNK